MLNLKFGTDNVVRLPRSPWSVGCVSLENSLFLSLCAGSLMRVSAEDYGLLWGFCYLLSRLRCPSLVLFFPLSTPRGMLINDCYSAITEIGGKKEGHVTLNCTVCGGVLMCSGSTCGLSVPLLFTYNGRCHLPHTRRQRFGGI